MVDEKFHLKLNLKKKLLVAERRFKPKFEEPDFGKEKSNKYVQDYRNSVYNTT
jgi:hypothetical protein